MTLLNYLHNILFYKIYKNNKTWKLNRLNKVIKALVEDNILESYPYIENGTYHWTGINYPIVGLDLVFHDIPLAIIVADRYYGKFSDVRKYIPLREHWESYMENISNSIQACILTNFPCLFIDPDDPIDKNSLSIKIQKLLDEEFKEHIEDDITN